MKKKAIIFCLSLLLITLCGVSSYIGFKVALDKQPTNNNFPVITTSTGNDNDNIPNVVAAVDKSVVEITTESVSHSSFMSDYVSEGAGSGVIVTEDGYIATNNHVIDNAKSVVVTTKDGKSYDAKIIGTDAQTDLALLKIEGKGLTAAKYGDSDKLAVGETAIAIGNPLGRLGGTVTSGIISAKDREINVANQTMHLLQTSAPLNPGNSGGGLFNTKGELIGIVNAKAGNASENLGFAIPSNTAKEILNALKDNGKVTGRFQIGIRTYDLSSKELAEQNGFSQPGLYISEIINDSNADDADLKEGDLLIKVDGKTVTSSKELRKILDGHKVNDKIKVSVERDKKEIDIDLTLKETK
ncbi:MAG: trypsin-like peptidase domain-containing protein [Erysipelotrichaceae bacterium]